MFSYCSFQQNEVFYMLHRGLKVVSAVRRKLLIHFEIIYDFFEKKIGSI